MRQSDPEFLFAISEIRMGKCSERTQQFLSFLQRDLPDDVEKVATHIFFRKVNAHLFNRQKISELAGELLSFDAEYENDQSRSTSTESWPGQRLLQLKFETKVMLVWNKSDDLRNGSIGTFVGIRGASLLISFADVGVVEISKETWIKRDRNGVKVGSVTQFPIIPAFAITCDKSQGLTLPAVVLHCSHEYVPGLIYVAMSRVKSPDNIQILNFNANQLLKPGSDVLVYSSSNDTRDTMEDLSCCCHQVLNSELLFTVNSHLSVSNVEVEEIDDSFYFPASTSDEHTSENFKEDTILVSCDLAEVYEQLTENESSLAMPCNEDIKKLKEYILSLKSTEAHTIFVKQENIAIDLLLNQENVRQLDSFISVVWYQSYVAVRDHVFENGDNDDVVFNFQRQHFTEATAGMHEFFTSSTFVNYLCAIFSCLKPSAPQRTIAIKFSMEIYKSFLRHLVSLMQEHHDCAEIYFNVEDMSSSGRFKVHHAGGWAIRKIITTYRKYVHQNMYSSNACTMTSVHTKQKLCDLLDENVIIPFAKLQEESKFPETLEVIEARQYRERGLLHVSDEAYLFFMCLEKKRVKLLNTHRFNKEKEDMVQNALNALSKDEDVLVSWKSCFGTIDILQHMVSVVNIFTCINNLSPKRV